MPGVKKRRGTVRSSITRLVNRLAVLESQADRPTTYDLAQNMVKKMDELDKEFRQHHLQLVDLIDDADEDALAKAQEDLDSHDDTLADANIRLRQLLATSSSSANSSQRKALSRQLARLQKSVKSIHGAVKPLTTTSDSCLIRQYEERLQAHKTDLGDVATNLLAMELEDSDDLFIAHGELEELIFDCDLSIKRLHAPASHTGGLSATHPSSVDCKGFKLPKLDAPTFDGKLINWRSFWEQFDVAIHSQSSLSDAEKLAYLRNSLKGGSARSIIEGLSRSGEFYAEAIETLKARYDRPRLIHQSHVRMIIDAPGLKDGTGREITPPS